MEGKKDEGEDTNGKNEAEQEAQKEEVEKRKTKRQTERKKKEVEDSHSLKIPNAHGGKMHEDISSTRSFK